MSNLNYKNAANPQWGDSEHSFINIWVWFEHENDWVMFSANPNDPEEHGREIFDKASNGGFGEITDFDSSQPITPPLKPEWIPVTGPFC